MEPGDSYAVTIDGKPRDGMVLAVDVNSHLALVEADVDGADQLVEVGIRRHGTNGHRLLNPEQAGPWAPLVGQAGFSWPRPWAAVPADLVSRVKAVKCFPAYGAGGRKIIHCGPVLNGWPYRFPWTESRDLQMAMVHLDKADAHDVQAERERRYIADGSALASPASLERIQELAAEERQQAYEIAQKAAWPMRKRVVLPDWMKR